MSAVQSRLLVGFGPEQWLGLDWNQWPVSVEYAFKRLKLRDGDFVACQKRVNAISNGPVSPPLQRILSEVGGCFFENLNLRFEAYIF